MGRDWPVKPTSRELLTLPALRTSIILWGFCNVANDYHRRSVPEAPLTDDASDDEIKDGVSGEDHEGSASAVLEAVMSLPDAYRETLILRLVEGMTGPEIAARTGMTHGSVRVNLHRGMEQLRAKLSPYPRCDRPEQEKS